MIELRWLDRPKTYTDGENSYVAVERVLQYRVDASHGLDTSWSGWQDVPAVRE